MFSQLILFQEGRDEIIRNFFIDPRGCMLSAAIVVVVVRRRGVRGRRLEVEGRGDGVIVSESMWIRHQNENGRAAFSDFSTLRPGFKKVCFQALRFQDLCGRSDKTMQYMCIFAKEHCRLDGA